MKLIIEIDTGGAAFASIGDRGGIAAAGWQAGAEVEVARLVHLIAGQIETGLPTGTLLDMNGNTVGAWVVEEEPEYDRTPIPVSAAAMESIGE